MENTEPFSLTKSELLSSTRDEGPRAETLSGRVFHSVHDALSPGVLLSQEQKKERAQHSDQLATVFADTLAMLPGLRARTAGLVRAGALLKLNGDSSDIAMNFGKDFAEGAILSKVAGSFGKEGFITKSVDARFGKTLLGESVHLAGLGASIGSVTTAFRQESWLNKEGKFSALHGAGEIFKGGAVGGVLSVPAGMLSNRISHLGIRLGAEGKVSSSTALAISGLGSGYLSGVAIGGAQGLMHAKSFSEFLQYTQEGGLTGALSSSVGLLAMVRPKANFRANETQSIHEELVRNPIQDLSIEAAESSALMLKARQHLELWESLRITEKVDLSEQTLEARLNDLGPFQKAKMKYWVEGPNAAEIIKTSATDSDFINRGGMVLQEHDVRVYYRNGVTITIPEGYAGKLDEVMTLRVNAAKDPDFYVKGPDHARMVLEAQEALEVHPLKDNAHPVDFAHLIDESIDRRLYSDLFIREDRSPADLLREKSKGTSFRAAADAGQTDKRITFYGGRMRTEDLRYYMNHETGHFAKWAAIEESANFDKVAELEKDGYYVSEYAKTNHDENWSEGYSVLLGHDPDKFFALVHGAPLRTVDMARAVTKTLAQTPGDLAGVNKADISKRIGYIQKYVVPEANAALADHLLNGPLENARLAAELLPRMGAADEIALLVDTARTHPNKGTRDAAFDSMLSTLSQGPNAKKASDTNQARLRDFLVAQIENNGKSGERALGMLGKMTDSTSQFYAQLFQIDQLRGNRLSHALNFMDNAPDTRGLKLAWAEAFGTAQTADDRVDLALRALGRHPRLINESVTVLAKEAQPRTRPFLSDLTNYWDTSIVETAREGLKVIDRNHRFVELSTNLQNSDPQSRINAAESMAATKDSRAIPRLIDAYVNAQTSVERDAIGVAVKKHISPEIWKFELRRRKADPTRNDARVLDRLMQQKTAQVHVLN